MELIHENSVVVLATGITTTTRVSSVFTNATVTGANVASLLPVVVQSGRLFFVLKAVSFFIIRELERRVRMKKPVR